MYWLKHLPALAVALLLAYLIDNASNRVVALERQIETLRTIEVTVGSPHHPKCRVKINLLALLELGVDNVEGWAEACTRAMEQTDEAPSGPRRRT